ncbi:hypothetical protein AMTR_s00087p00131480 [Amborella trichopoda]|uniref:Uncharacterized protein n=1 Tax=Amborella trichopoda TaxID=13333 RepID=W1P4S8_AMBTC|nr:hypothetical protein AMTR_s00087p00131480 [Amborella trichopoda]
MVTEGWFPAAACEDGLRGGSRVVEREAARRRYGDSQQEVGDDDSRVKRMEEDGGLQIVGYGHVRRLRWSMGSRAMGGG